MIRPATAADRRFGMTLIELLVVVGILGLLSVIVLPAISGNEESRLGRAAAEQVAGLINQARNDAMGSGRPAGVTIRPVSTGAAAAIDLFRCRVPPAYRGDTTSAKLTFTFTLSSPRVEPSVLGCIDLISNAGVAAGDLIQFDDHGPTYAIGPNPGPSGFQLAMRTTDAGQANANTPWPPVGVPMTFAIQRRPRVAGSPVSLGQGRCADLAWSGFAGGVSGFETFGLGSTVAITFDARGQVSQILKNDVRKTVNGPIFLLIGRTDRAGASYSNTGGPTAADDSIGANWQYPSSYWIAIDPASGQVRTSECQPNVGDDVVASRAWASQALVSQGM